MWLKRIILITLLVIASPPASHAASDALLGFLRGFLGAEAAKQRNSYSYGTNIEVVLVVGILDNPDEAIIQRRSGEFYFVEKSFGCYSLWRYEGKEVLVLSPGLFLGLGSTIILANEAQECRVLRSELITSANLRN